MGRGVLGRVQEGSKCGAVVVLFPWGHGCGISSWLRRVTTHTKYCPQGSSSKPVCPEVYWGSIRWSLCGWSWVSSCPGGPASTFTHQLLWGLELMVCETPIITPRALLDSGGLRPQENKRLPSGRAFRQCLEGKEREYDTYAEPNILPAHTCYSIFTVFRERYYFLYLQDKRTRLKSNHKNSKGARMWSWVLLTPKGMLFSQYQTWIWGAVSLCRHEWRFQCKQPPLLRDEKG